MPDNQLLDNGRGVIDPDTYFETNSPPANLSEFEAKTTEFVKHHGALGNSVVLITSGGTMVPLENQTVRFIDNFSAGTRGAVSAEKFLENGYAVIFMHRQFSLQPYSRHYTHSPNSFLDYMTLNEDGKIEVDAKYASSMAENLAKYNNARNNNMLLLVDFVTLSDYLFQLKSFTRILDTLGRNAMYYLAAAVSDFFIPVEKMAEHKIQSRGGALTLTLDQVPKFLKPLVSVWASNGLIVSFKLETDQKLLVPKARQALKTYGHQIVIGNMLSTRKKTVTFITQDSEHVLSLSQEEVDKGVEIESKIVSELIRYHREWISHGTLDV
ncbi:DNA/pantothenate metabolism flavoprotein [Umbelopsis sp. PMI_123]|nr:DNA/pantothenate metabolism flavoprotein [Umbelopsis sp. PMI_123]